MLSPIIIFAYNRPEHTRKTLESLMANDLADQSTLFIYADGPKEGTSYENLDKIKKTREVIREKQWCKEVHIVESEKNKGLANSVIGGVSDIINKFGRIIVLEDDLLLSNIFLRYMNDALDKYENQPKVMQISGYMHPVNTSSKVDCFFLPTINSWGWGTWKRAWDNFDAQARGFESIRKDKELRKKFDLNNSYPFYKMLKTQKNKGIDSWAVRFYLSVFMRGGLTLYPKYTLVKNIGMDGSGVHCKIESLQNDVVDSFEVEIYPSDIGVSFSAQKKLEEFFKKQMSIKSRCLRYLDQYFIKKF